MQNQNLRQIVFFDLNLTTSPSGRLRPMAELAGFLKERVDADRCVRRIEADRYLIGIVDADFVTLPDGNKALALLFVFADPDAADPANMHLETRAIRRFAKEEGEGRAFSAHALLSLTPREYGGSVFRILLENAERLGKTRVGTELHRQFKGVFKEKGITVENIDGDDVPAKLKLDLDAIASDRLRQGMQEGELKEVRLIDARAADRGWDAPDAVKVRRREMSLKVEVRRVLPSAGLPARPRS